MVEKTQKRALINEQLDSFLNDWKVMCLDLCPKEIDRLHEYRSKIRREIIGDRDYSTLPIKVVREYEEKVASYERSMSSLSRKLLDSPYGPARDRDGRLNEKTMNWFSEYLDKDILRKKQNLFARCEEKIGEPTSISLARVGAKGEIEGYVSGEGGTLHIQTITAGGYNIQRLHFRFLVKKVKNVI